MFDTLSQRLSDTLKQVTGKAKLTEDNIKSTLREVRMALLEADVALSTVKDFIARVSECAIGAQVQDSLNPGQAFVKLVNAELITVMGSACEKLNLASQPPAVILMAGLQGAGKTTSVAKLARHLQQVEKKSVMVASVDVYRPAAIEQLKTLAHEVQADFIPTNTDHAPLRIAENALNQAQLQHKDVLIIDTAGRLHIDQDMMDEIQQLQKSLKPIETLFVVDAMTGQDAANTAKAFNDALDLTGVILTKVDGDARGGAALSVRHITGKPIKFLGVGEKTDALEYFHPERIASRILGMGDVLSLIEAAEHNLDRKKAGQLAKKIKKGKPFDLNDFRDQLQQMKQMGGLTGVMSKLPGMGNSMPQIGNNAMSDTMMTHMEAIISSMTAKERCAPDIINGSRKRRIAKGSGTQIQDVNRLIKQHKNMQKMMKKVSGKGGMTKMMRGLGALSGGAGGLLNPGSGRFPKL